MLSVTTSIRPRVRQGLLVSLIVVLSGCAASQSLKLADEAESQGDYYRAAQSYLTVLKGSFKKADALSKLSMIAEPAYLQKLEMAENLTAQDRFEPAINEYRQIGAFLAQLRQHNLVNFSTIDVDGAITDASRSAAESYYVEAENHFANQNYDRAITSYEKVRTLANSYKDTRQKLASSHYRLGVGAEKTGRLRAAIDEYLEADNVVSGYQGSRRRAGDIHYYIADHFLAEGHCRQAHNDFSRANEYGSAGPDISDKLAEARECGTVKIAFMEFENNTGRTFPGMDLGDFIFESIKTKTQARASDFIRLMDREQLGMLLREQRIDAGILTTGGALQNTIEGVDFLIFGKINQLEKNHAGQRRSNRQTSYEYSVERTYKDSEGKQKKRTEWVEQPMTYTVISDARDVVMSGAIRAVNARTSEVAINYIIDRQSGDQVEYAHSYQARHDLKASNIKLNSSFTELARARKELKEENTLAREMIDIISEDMANSILNTLDVAGRASDPTVIPLELPNIDS